MQLRLRVVTLPIPLFKENCPCFQQGLPPGGARRDCALGLGESIQEACDESLLETVRELEWNVSGWVQIPGSADGLSAASRFAAIFGF